MNPCACSMSSLHGHRALLCCRLAQVRGAKSGERHGGVSDSAVAARRSAGQVCTLDNRGNSTRTFSSGGTDANPFVLKIRGGQSGAAARRKDLVKAKPSRKPAVEVRYRVQDVVDIGEVVENGTDYPRRRNRDRTRRKPSGERRRKLQILGNNGMVDLEEQLGLISSEDERSQEQYGGDDSAGVSVSDEGRRRLLESSLLKDDILELERRQQRIAAANHKARRSAQPGQALDRREVTLDGTETSASGGQDSDVIEAGASKQVLEREGFGSDVVLNTDLDTNGNQNSRAIAELPGGRRVVELVAAWDGLAGRLPPEFSRSSDSDLVLRALKLIIMALEHNAPDDERTPWCRALAVAHILVDLGMDAEVISTGLLREASNSGLVNYVDIEENVGGDIAHLLRDCHRVRHIPSRVDTLDDDSAKALRQFCLAFHDIRAVVVELASQLDAMRHIHSIPRYRQQILALETMQIYAPLAHALGTDSMAIELEDLGFRVLFPDSYSYIETWLRSHWKDGGRVVDKLKEQLSAALRMDSEIQHLVSTVNVVGRYKSRFSTMRKLLKDGRTPEEVYDVLGLRVILEPRADAGDGLTERERGIRACYRAMKIATNIWQEVPGRVKDYIENRKENGYESLHVAVNVGDQSNRRPPMEIQIRTTDMDAAAVSGEASHSLYKGGMTDPEQVKNLKLVMLAAANAAASRFGDIAGNAVGLESRCYAYGDEDQMFKMFDKNQDGVINLDEFREVIIELGADEGDALELMQIVDVNTDGSVSADEFGKFRHQIQVHQSLAGVDRECRTQLGSKLQGDNNPLTEGVSRHSGTSSANIAGLLPEKTEEVRETSGVPSDEFARSSSSSGSFCEDENDNKGESMVIASEGDSQYFEHTGRTGAGAEFPPLQVKPQVISGQLGEAVEKFSKPSSAEVLVAPKAEEEISKWPRSVKAAFLADGADREVSDDASTETEIESSAEALVAPKAEEEISKWPRSVKAVFLADGSDREVSDDTSTETEIEPALSSIRQKLAEGNLVLARDLSAKVSSDHPGSAKVLIHHASVERKCGNFEASGALYAKAIDLLEFKEDLGTEYVRALQAWASLEAKSGNHSKARYLYSHSMKASEKGDDGSALREAGVYGLHGWALLEERSGNWTKARDLLERAALLQPGNAVVHQSRATVEAKAHNYSAARVHFSRAVEAAPKDVKCWHAWAKFEASKGNMEKARALFQNALEVDPKNVHSMQSWAQYEARVGTPKALSQARKLYQNCADVDPKNVHCWQSWGILEQDVENYERARYLFKQGLKANGRNVPCLQAYAHMERKCGNLNIAVTLLQRSLKVEPNNAAVLMELALVQDMLGNGNAALDLYKQAASLDKQKSAVKRRTFESRNWDRQAKGHAKQPRESVPRPRIRSSSKRKSSESPSRLSGINSDERQSRYERVYASSTLDR